ncbi:hypothetical protein PHJA_003013800, partial [Phtheirospermum japonicum]
GDSVAAVRNSSLVARLTIERSRSNGGWGSCTGRMSSAINSPSLKVSAFRFCGAFGDNKKTRHRAKKSRKRVM